METEAGSIGSIPIHFSLLPPIAWRAGEALAGNSSVKVRKMLCDDSVITTHLPSILKFTSKNVQHRQDYKHSELNEDLIFQLFDFTFIGESKPLLQNYLS